MKSKPCSNTFNSRTGLQSSKKIAVQRKHFFENYKSDAAIINFSQLSRIIFTSLLFIGCNEQKAVGVQIDGRPLQTLILIIIPLTPNFYFFSTPPHLLEDANNGTDQNVGMSWVTLPISHIFSSKFVCFWQGIVWVAPNYFHLSFSTMELPKKLTPPELSYSHSRS